MKPVESFEAKSATVNPAILEIAVRLAPWVERTRLVPLAGPGYEETVESLRAQGYAPTKLAQALTIRDASWFPFRSLSFVARGDEFLSPLPDGRVATCHAAWDHEGRRFWSVSAADIPASLFDSYTRIEKRA